jgi:TonB family protein
MAVAVYQLKSDLARVCLPAPDRSAQRRLAWVNSICIFFLIIGVTGARTRLPVVGRPPPIEQPVPVVVEPMAAPPPTVQPKEVEPQNQDEKQIAPQVVAVTLNTPAVDFSVPTVGNLVVPMAAAPAPPAVELKPTVQAVKGPAEAENTGVSGDRPKPDYPPLAEQMGQTGIVTVNFTVDDVGKVISISVKESSGHVLLDQGAVKWIKGHWIQPPINGNHFFETRINYAFPK